MVNSQDLPPSPPAAIASEPLDLLVTNIVTVPRFYYYLLSSDGRLSCAGKLTDQQYNHDWAWKASNYVAILRGRTLHDITCIWHAEPKTLIVLCTTNLPAFEDSLPKSPAPVMMTNVIIYTTNSPLKSTSQSSLAPQLWSESPFSYTTIFGQEPRLDSVTGEQAGWEIAFRFLQESNRCYRICASNEVGWRPLSSICQQPEEATSTFAVPVFNFPQDWSPWDPQWSPLTNLVTTADAISYKLEAQQ